MKHQPVDIFYLNLDLNEFQTLHKLNNKIDITIYTIYKLIEFRCNKFYEFQATNDYIAELLKISVKSVSRHIKVLNDCNLIKCIYKKDGIKTIRIIVIPAGQKVPSAVKNKNVKFTDRYNKKIKSVPMGQFDPQINNYINNSKITEKIDKIAVPDAVKNNPDNYKKISADIKKMLADKKKSFDY
jgi:DNA-binding MarR family transcriptional regulator